MVGFPLGARFQTFNFIQQVDAFELNEMVDLHHDVSQSRKSKVFIFRKIIDWPVFQNFILYSCHF